MTTKAQQEKEAADKAALDDAVAALVATGMDPEAAAAKAAEAAPPAGPDDGGFTGEGTKEPAANPKSTSAKRARAGSRVKAAATDEQTSEETLTTAAAILGMHADEVLLVEDVDGDWPVATTFDGQKYQLTGLDRGDFVWLPNTPAVPQLLA